MYINLIKILPLFDLIKVSINKHKWLIAIVIPYAIGALYIQKHLLSNYKRILIFDGIGIITTSIIWMFIFSCYSIYVMVFIRPNRLAHYLQINLRPHLNIERLIHSLPVIILLPVFISSFTIFKSAIQTFNPYEWDERLAEWDRILHLGVDPWRWLQILLSFPLLTFVVNFFYNLWFFILYMVIYYLAFSLNNQKLRMQFFLSFILSWIMLGTILATVFSSAGPCYYGNLFPEKNPFLSLMLYLHDANKHFPIWALDAQQMLWNNANNKTASYQLGISAMPSMHVATTVLIALWTLRINRGLGIAGIIFTLIILIGSIHLGWHYALDGYIGGLGAYLIWHGVGWMQRQTELKESTRNLLSNI